MRYLPALVVDAVLVLVFAVIGRLSHGEDAAGFLLTAWPFLVALLVGYLAASLLPGRPRRPWSLRWGTVVWVVTVAGGMLLRLLSGDTAQVAFIVVATIVLAVFLLGWRAVAALLRRRRSATGASAGETESGVAGEVDRTVEETKDVAGDAADPDAAPDAVDPDPDGPRPIA